VKTGASYAASKSISISFAQEAEETSEMINNTNKSFW
jgi:hypothetical protein